MKTSHSRSKSWQAKASAEPHWPAPVSVDELADPGLAGCSRPARRRCSACASRPARRPRTCSRCAPGYRARARAGGRGRAASAARACRVSRTSSGISISGSAETSCSISAIGKSGARSSGPSGSLVPGMKRRQRLAGQVGDTLTQCVGISDSGSRNWTCSLALTASPLGSIGPLDCMSAARATEPHLPLAARELA